VALGLSADTTLTRTAAGVMRTNGAYSSGGKANIAAAESTTATSYAIGNLTTPDRVQNVVMPTDGLIAVWYQAIWQNTVSGNRGDDRAGCRFRTRRPRLHLRRRRHL
jgi:hypothetical protein